MIARVLRIGRRNRLPHHGRSSSCREVGQAVSPVGFYDAQGVPQMIRLRIPVELLTEAAAPPVATVEPNWMLN
jgi:hypothetical protein